MLFRVPMAVVLVLAVLGGCAGENPPAENNDQGSTTWGADQSQLSDQFVWPDQAQSQKDQQIVWPDSYSSTPFGCVSDTDCFNLRCCPTPWGVKICASDCFSL